MRLAPWIFVWAWPWAMSPAKAAPISLPQAVERALDQSYRIKTAAAEHAAQVEKTRSSWADMGPRLKGDYNELHYPNALSFQINPAAPPITVRPEVIKTGVLTLAQPITGMAVFFEKARAERVQRDMKEASLRLTKAEVSFQTAERWLETYQLLRQLDIAKGSVAAAENQLKDARALERVGRLNRGDVLRLELAVSEAKARQAQAQVGVDMSQASLRDLLGFTGGETLELGESLPAVPPTDPELNQAESTALRRRLELDRARGGIQLAGLGKKLAYAQFVPTVNVFGQITRNFADPLPLGAERQFRTYGVQVSWDIWNNGSQVFAVRQAAEEEVKAEEMVKGAESGIKLEVQAALANLKAAREGLALAKVAVEQASEAYRIEQARFKTGTRSASDLILAEASEAGAKGRLVAAQTSLINWNFKLQKALGEELPLIKEESVR